MLSAQIIKLSYKKRVRGEPVSTTNGGNKINSFDITRTDPRAKVFNAAYDTKGYGDIHE